MTRLSTYLLPTEKQAPADAEALSHKLMVRAGLIRQLGSGLWTFLPAGWKVHEKVVQIIREEMNRVGGQEGPEAGAELADQAGADHQLVRERLCVRGRLLLGRQEVGG